MTSQLEARNGPSGHRRGPSLCGRLAAGWAVVAASLAAVGPARADDAWFGPDKALHFGASTGVAVVGYGLTSLAGGDRAQRSAVGLGAALVVGALKEGYDAAGHGDPSWKDFTWDALGALTGVGLALVVDVVARGGARARDTSSASSGEPLVRW